MKNKMVLAIFGLLAFGMGSFSAQADCDAARVTDATETADGEPSSAPTTPTAPATAAETPD